MVKEIHQILSKYKKTGQDYWALSYGEGIDEKNNIGYHVYEICDPNRGRIEPKGRINPSVDPITGPSCIAEILAWLSEKEEIISINVSESGDPFSRSVPYAKTTTIITKFPIRS